jgi:hypothetical protein
MTKIWDVIKRGCIGEMTLRLGSAIIETPNAYLHLSLAKLYQAGADAPKVEEFRRSAAALKN